jgi:hypothetical protein
VGKRKLSDDGIAARQITEVWVLNRREEQAVALPELKTFPACTRRHRAESANAPRKNAATHKCFTVLDSGPAANNSSLKDLRANANT